MNYFENVYQGKRVLVTGHTGFKGSWLSLWLKELGAQVSGISLAAETNPNHSNILNLNIDETLLDIRNLNKVKEAVNKYKPDLVFHLAAQTLVRRSYLDPIGTWSTNVMGSVNVLEACRQQKSINSIVVISSDKCYKNNEWYWGYRESDQLGGHDSYSASKAATEFVADSYRLSFFNKAHSPLLATARAGNVIGGGDWSEDRLIPDMVRSINLNQSLEIRSPFATRPWQHVLEALSGYLALGQHLLQGKEDFAEAWNFGPDPDGDRTVEVVLGILHEQWPQLKWHINNENKLHESTLLFLDSSKAKNRLKWQPVWNVETTLAKTTDWYRAWLDKRKIISQYQINEYSLAAQKKGVAWAKL